LDIENEEIRCSEGCAIKKIIDYVKRFLQLFHQVKEKVKRDLSSHETVNFFFGMKQGVMWNRLTKVNFMLKSMLCVLESFLKSEEHNVL